MGLRRDWGIDQIHGVKPVCFHVFGPIRNPRVKKMTINKIEIVMSDIYVRLVIEIAMVSFIFFTGGDYEKVLYYVLPGSHGMAARLRCRRHSTLF